MKLLKKSIKLPLITVAIFGITILLFYVYGVIINLTPSLPYGFYIRVNSKISTGDYVAFCLPPEYQKIGLERKYLEAGSTCNGSVPLVKKIIALPYQHVTLADSFIAIDDKKLQFKTIKFDSLNRPLDSYPRGSYRLNCYWMIGSNDYLHSWDSRYWGCIASDRILYKIKPLLTWE